MALDGEKRGLVKAASMMSGFILLSRVTGLLREIVRAHLLGTGWMADAFTVAFMLPNLFRRLVGEGAMTAAMVPVLVEEKEKSGVVRVAEVFNRFLTLFTFAVTLLCLLAVLFAGPLLSNVFARGFADDPAKLALTVSLTRWMFFYLLFIGLAAVLQAALNSFRVFGPSAFTPILLNLSVILSALALRDAFEVPAYALAFGVMLGGLLQLLFQAPYVVRIGIRFRVSFVWSDPSVRRVLKLMAPGLLGAGVYQINVLLSQMIATYLAEGSVSSLQYSARLIEFVLGVFIVAVSTAALPAFSQFVAQGRHEELKDTLTFALRQTALFTVPATVLFILLRVPIINLLLRTGEFDQTSVDLTAFAFLFHTLGLYFIGVGRVLVPVFYAHKDLVTPVKAAVVSTAVNLVLCGVLAGPLAQGGIALANSLSALAQVAVLLIYFVPLHGALPWRTLGLSLGRILVCSALAGGVAAALVAAFDLTTVTSRWVLLPALAGIGAASLGLFVLSSLLVRSRELTEWYGVVLERFRRKRR